MPALAIFSLNHMTKTKVFRLAVLLALLANCLVVIRFMAGAVPNKDGYLFQMNWSESEDSHFMIQETEKDLSWKDQSAYIPLKELLSTTPNEELPACGNNTFRFESIVLPEHVTHNASKIPHIVHLTSKYDCLTSKFISVMNKWKFPGFSVVLHDDRALERLLHKEWPEFPHIDLVRPCMISGAAKADLWRAVVLWEYGGIYADIDVGPGPWFANGTFIEPDDQAFFVKDMATKTLSQYFMAAAPKHPLMYLVVQHTLKQLLEVENVGMQYVPQVTGPGAVKAATKSFLFNSSGHFQKSKNETYQGIGNYTLRVVTRRSQLVIQRDAVKGQLKDDDYSTMGMVHFSKSGKEDLQDSCLTHLSKLDLIRRGMMNQTERSA